jgi:hypothetical protein
MSADEWLDTAQGNGNIHYAVPFDELVCSGANEKWTPMQEWPTECGSGSQDATYGENWRHYTLIAPEYGSNDNHTGYVWTIDTTDPTKPFLVSKWRLPGEGMKENGSSHPQHWITEILGPAVTPTGRTTTLAPGPPITDTCGRNWSGRTGYQSPIAASGQ